MKNFRMHLLQFRKGKAYQKTELMLMLPR